MPHTAPAIKPTHKAVKDHYAALETCARQRVKHETALRSAFQSLLEKIGRAVCLLYKGVMGDKRPDEGNVLTRELLKRLPPHDGPRVIYGEGCRLGPARLNRERSLFRPIPYEIKVS